MKTTRTQIDSSDRETSARMELIHIDLLGPMPNLSIDGRQYTLGILDDYTAKSGVFFLTHKPEIYDFVKS